MPLVLPTTRDGTELKSFGSFAEAFDPRLNRVWEKPLDLDGVRGSLLSILKAVYSRQNILENLFLFFPVNTGELGPGAIKHLTEFVTECPEEDLFLCAFMMFPNLDRRGTGSSLVYSVRYGYLSWEASSKDSIRRTIDAVFDKAKQFWTQDMLARYLDNNSSGFVDNLPEFNLLWWVDRFYTDSPCIFHTSRMLSPSQVSDMVSSGNDFEFKAEQHPEYGQGRFLIRVMCYATAQNKTILYKLYDYSTSPLAMIKWPILQKGELKPNVFGVELEVSTEYSVKETVDASDQPFFLCKSDSSIRGSRPNKFEIVTVPMSLKSHRILWAEFLESLDYSFFDCTTSTNNGFHVHVARTAFANQEHQNRFCWLFMDPQNYVFWRDISERSERSMRDYSASWLVHSEMFHSKAQQLKNIQYFASAQGRGIVNVNNSKGTLEVRLFKGIVSYASIIKNLECVDAAFEFTQMSPSMSSTTLSAFLTYVNKTPKNKYIALKKFLELIRAHETVTILSLFGNLRQKKMTSHQMLGLVNSCGLTASQTLVDNVNHILGTKLFDFKNGSICLYTRNRSKIFEYDSVFSKGYVKTRKLKAIPAAKYSDEERVEVNYHNELQEEEEDGEF